MPLDPLTETVPDVSAARRHVRFGNAEITARHPKTNGPQQTASLHTAQLATAASTVTRQTHREWYETVTALRGHHTTGEAVAGAAAIGSSVTIRMTRKLK